MSHEETPRQGSLYRTIAKDYQPKQAEMKICKYIEGLEARITDLEKALIDTPLPDPVRTKVSKKKTTDEAKE